MLRSVKLLVAALALSWPLSAQAMQVTFEWDPVDQTVAGTTGSTTVTLNAIQTDGADAAGITLGIDVAGAITGFDLLSYGALVSASDSFCCDLGGTAGIIAIAPASPGSFGQDVDFEVATFTLFYDFGMGAEGTVSLVDLSTVAGFPAADAVNMEIPSDLSAVHTVVPEPTTALLLVAGLMGLAVRGHPAA